MYRLFLGNISTLSLATLPSALAESAPEGTRRSAWLAGRALLCHAVSPLPEIQLGDQGKPGFDERHALWFNLSHSGDNIALLVSDEGEVGCDIEMLRPRPQWQQLANATFTGNEHIEIEREAEEHRLTAFWRIWTRKEAMVKQRGGSAWQIVSYDSTAPLNLHLSDLQHEGLSLAVCTPTPFTVSTEVIERVG
ncbi:4'-phosphopantetheinyl transferase AcpT [Enterobacter sp. CC120223-11]|uniref:4'-phosphopantetheinyl transferase AcpT n=1 Tax=Enterobacter sp. CC120223-11 TaxID=1378073 RepID=UPI000BD8F834|nr:4'-phosphopantetheinyl transferase AcpT [Enterobacter sp. CC120223-11]SNY71672.1 4'-phosphopantetheinyl transferase [Enterobacter sp. CC120223-11]